MPDSPESSSTAITPAFGEQPARPAQPQAHDSGSRQVDASVAAVCVFCGGQPGGNDTYRSAAAAVGALLARRGITLVYGGGGIGLMGVVANAALAQDGTVLGIIPHGLLGPELAHPDVAELRVVASMHARKEEMVAAADAFIVLPGGFGTLDELAEVLTWAQLGIHRKPIGLLNVAGFFDLFLAHLDRAVAEGFLRPLHRELLLVDADPESLLERLRTWQSPITARWSTPEETPQP